VISHDGERVARAEREVETADAERAGREAALEVLDAGGAELLEAARDPGPA